MNEWPTRVRTGSPPCSRTISGTAREGIRLWMIVVPRPFPSPPPPTRAGTADGLPRPRGGAGGGAPRPAGLVDDEHAVGVTVEGQADVGAVRPDRGLQVDEVGG